MWAHWNNITVTKLIPNMFIPALHTRQTSSPHGIEESHDVLCGMACHSSWRATVSSSMFLGGLSRFLILSPSNAHTFSTGLMSGDFAGQSITTIPASARNAVQTLAVCGRVLSCWNISTSGWFCMNGSTCCYRILSLYRTPLRFPWITTRSVWYNPEIPPHTMRDAPPPYLYVSLMHGSASLSFLLFHTLPPPSTPSSMNGLSSDIRIWIWSFISRGTKVKWQDLEVRCSGGSTGLQQWQNVTLDFSVSS